MAKLPKNIIKKYGISKKAWSVFRGQKRTIKTGGNMAKKKGFSKKSSGMSLTNVLLAGAVYGVVRPMVANMLPTFFSIGPIDSDNVVLAGAGYYLGKKGGLMKAIGTVAIATEASIVTSKLVTGQTTGKSNNIASYDSGFSY